MLPFRQTTPLSPSGSHSDGALADRYDCVVETPSPVRSQSMDRLVNNNNDNATTGGPTGGIGVGVGGMDLIGRGLHVPIQALGVVENPPDTAPTGDQEQPKQKQQQQQQQEEQKEDGTQKSKMILSDVNARARKRSQAAVRATQSQAASAAAEAQSSRMEEIVGLGTLEASSSFMTLLTYGGVEVIFSTTSTSLVGVCSRTHFIFQKLRMASDSPVTSLTSNSLSGMIVVAHEDGIIQTYHPQRTDPNKISFGKFIWEDGLTIDASKVFYQSDERHAQFLNRTNPRSQPGQLVDISSSSDHKLLVAHKTQLAVYEAITRKMDPKSPRSTGARLLWTTMLPANIVTAKISGDGRGIVVVLEGDLDNEGNHGARTFFHDMDDGSLVQPTLERSVSVGMVFRQGPFLKHSAPVTRISFRGLGMVTSSTNLDPVGNDLLLTYCNSDSTVRIFNQNGWKQLMLWATPPNSRADWIRGSTAFSLGDLESEKKKGAKTPSRRPSGDASAAVGGAATPTPRSTTGSPTVAAGAWIAEITFRGAFPALRLSRLSYMKRGNDDSQPAHFESVAAILPAGSLVAASVLNSDDMGLAIQGVWPAWTPWLSDRTVNLHDQTLTGSAMEFIGLSSMPPLHLQYFGESYLGGSHSPPAELRIAAAHAVTGNVVVMEFPLWGDDDFGAMELGSPLRSVLSLSEALPDIPAGKGVNDQDLSGASIDYDSSRLCARIDPGQRSVSLLWRKQGGQSLCSPHYLADDAVYPKSISDNAYPLKPQWMDDKSIIAAPLALPSIRLPDGTSSVNEEKIVCIKWWPDDSFDGPPLLLLLTRSATLLVFEIPPPRSAREPTMPNVDPFTLPSSTGGEDIDEGDSGSESDDVVRSDYEVAVTPHPDFGMGLRLESPMDGLRAVAGSFKKHPLNGGMLPAEKTGMIVLGDEVLSVNGVSLENMTFDDVISTIRHIGAEAGPGKPLMLRFRPGEPDRVQGNSVALQESFRPIDHNAAPLSDLDMDRPQGTGTNPKRKGRNHSRKRSAGGSLAGMFIGSAGETQQEFGRAIAVMRDAVPCTDEEPNLDDRMVVTPLRNGVGFPCSGKTRGALLILVATGNTVLLKRMVLPINIDPDQAQLVDLGSVDIQEGQQIRSLHPVDVRGHDRCYAVTFDSGAVVLLFLELTESKSADSDSATLSVSFRQHKIFVLEKDSQNYEVVAASIDLLVVYEKEQAAEKRGLAIKVYSSRSNPMCRRPTSQSAIQDEFFERDYIGEEIVIGSSHMDALCDVQFVSSGQLDSFPTLVVFLTSEALVYQRRATRSKWVQIAQVSYSMIPSSHSRDDERLLATKTPCDVFPHILPMIHSVIPSFEENILLSDWHPESLLAYLCTDERGAKVAMKEQVGKIVGLLAELADSSSSNQNILSARSRLLVAPFEAVGGPSLLKASVGSEADAGVSSQSSASFFLSSGPPAETDEEKKLAKLLAVLETPRKHDRTIASSGKSEDFKMAMSLPSRQNTEEATDLLPPVLESFPDAELRVLWAIAELVKNPPAYDKIDSTGQFSLTILALHRTLKKSPLQPKTQTPASSPYGKSNLPSFYQRSRSASSIQKKSKLSPQCASVAALSALLSGYQGYLVDNFRGQNAKLDWNIVRESRAAFWIRSDDKLRQISEQVGQNLYRESRDILQAAIFFLAAGKLRTLRNLAAADNTDSGKKFYKFLTSFDFSTERGRSAAEKNAFSLLRKNKYDYAAAFFLLAQPPLLQSAVETIASKMEDLDLAFLVSRLIANAEASAAGSQMGFREAGIGFGAVLGGGGGYAGMSSFATPDLEKDKDSFEEWNPKLSSDTVSLVESRMLPTVSEDHPLCAILLLWLRRKEDAWHWLSGLVRRKNSMFSEFVRDCDLFKLHETTSLAKKSQDPTIEMTNAYINFVAAPLLLRQMNAAAGTQAASAMLVASALYRMGIELPAVRSLSHAATDNVQADADRRESKAKPAKASTDSSIFDSFDPAPQTKPRAAPSIFDSFDPAPQPTPRAAPSIFDSFDPAPRPTPSAAPSIFDSFDPAPQPKPRAAPSIFDSFDPAPQPKPKAVTSIFDSFDPAPQPKPRAAPSIFDQFDGPPRQTAPKASPAQAQSSIFDSFDVPVPRPAVAAPQADMTSSIFDSFDVPRPPRNQIAASTTGATSQINANGGSSPLDREAKAGNSRENVVESQEPRRPLPPVWKEWRRQLLINCAARRIIREMATIGSSFHLDEFHPTIFPRGKQNNPIVPTYAAQVLQRHANGGEIIGEIQACLHLLSGTVGIEASVIVQEALSVLESPYQYRRVCFAVLLHLAMDQQDEAEDIVRNTSHYLIEKCSGLSFSNDRVGSSKQTVSHLGSLPQRQIVAHFSWQLELCLWLHRGGALPMSGLALNESICAVRIGMLIANWNRDFEAQETMLRQPADCLVDQLAGRQLCASLKMISTHIAVEKRASGVGSGGWEFLVECKRAEATELLRFRPTGSFIIRPHAEDHGVFTLSFKTNLIPSVDSDAVGKNEKEMGDAEQPKPQPRSVKRDDVVQHAIIRLSDSGFRCGSFGPFATLMKLLEAVSGSLPFKLRFDLPPTQGAIKDQGSKPSPNCAFLRKLGLSEGKRLIPEFDETLGTAPSDGEPISELGEGAVSVPRRRQYACFLELVVLTELRKQLSGIASAKYDTFTWTKDKDTDSVESGSDDEIGPEQEYAVAARLLRPLLTWCRMVEISMVEELAPSFEDVSLVAYDCSDDAPDLAEEESRPSDLREDGDDVIRKMIKPGSGVEFRTLRLGEGGETAMVVLFSKKEAIDWFIKNSLVELEEDAVKRLEIMERKRVIEPLDFNLLLARPNKKKQESKHDDDQKEADDVAVKGIRYRLVDPWEVEPLDSREAETRGAVVGRHAFHPFGLGKVAASYELVVRSIGGQHLLALWSAGNGCVALTKAVATVHSPWERGAGGDLHLKNGAAAEPDPYDNSIRQHLYRNAMFRRLGLPPRFVALIQVELLDLKNLTSPGGSLSLTVYSLLRLKRPNSKAPLTMKARTLDSVATQPTKLGKVSGPNAPASWGSLVRFRFPLPEDTACDGRSNDSHRESLFKGAPSVLQVSVYEKKFMSDTLLGGADVVLNGLASGGQLEEWVPLRTETQGINWFARIRLTLRFELMCISKDAGSEGADAMVSSVGLRRIQHLSSIGGLHQDVRQSSSTPDLLSYFESIVS